MVKTRRVVRFVVSMTSLLKRNSLDGGDCDGGDG